MKTKKCFKCNQYKKLELFYKHPDMPDGHVNKCKSCNKKDVKDNYRKNIEHYKEYERTRFQTKERKEQNKLYARKRAILYKGKVRANRKLSNAIRDKKIIRKPCEVCGDVKSQGHHTDYRKPLDVKWLCFKHHREAHGQIVI